MEQPHIDAFKNFMQTHEKTTLSLAATAAGIATDKMRLLRNESTEITETKLEQHRWAEDKLQAMMREFDLGRDEAIRIVKEKATTLAAMLM